MSLRLIGKHAVLAAAMLASQSAHAETLSPDDPFEARVIASYNCNRGAEAGDYTEALARNCAIAYQRALDLLQATASIEPRQRNMLAMARSLAVMKVVAGYGELDGTMSARACNATRLLAVATGDYAANVTTAWDAVQDVAVAARDDAIPKCVAGGHLPAQ